MPSYRDYGAANCHALVSLYCFKRKQQNLGDGRYISVRRRTLTTFHEDTRVCAYDPYGKIFILFMEIFFFLFHYLYLSLNLLSLSFSFTYIFKIKVQDYSIKLKKKTLLHER